MVKNSFVAEVTLNFRSNKIKAGDELWVTDVLIQKEKVDIDREKGTQISIAAKKILTQDDAK